MSGPGVGARSDVRPSGSVAGPPTCGVAGKIRTGEDGPVPYRVCFVCSGNICRSPTAEAVLRRRLADAGLADRVVVDSAGLGDWHVGEAADRRSAAALRARGYPAWVHEAKQFRAADFDERDLVVALDAGHEAGLRDLARSARDRAKIRMLRSYDPGSATDPAGLDVPDPYFGGDQGFEQVLDLVEAACAGLLAEIEAGLANGGPTR
jgi:protein-tyrosine phosphatase